MEINMTEENRICTMCELSEEDGIILERYEDYDDEEYYCRDCIRDFERQYERHDRKRYCTRFSQWW